MANNVIQLAFGGETSVTSEELVYKYDYGQMIQFTDIELPEYFEVHFANSKTGRATTQIGYNNIVEIPNTYLSKGSVFGWIFLHDTESDGETEYEFKIPVKNRAVVRDAVTPEQESVITRAIAALTATQAEVQILHDETDEYKDAAEEASTSAITAQGLAEDAQTAAETAQSLAEAAQTAAETAQGLAEAAQTASESAQTAAETAQGLAEDARDEAVEAKDLVLGMSATAVTLDPDEPATADYEDGLLTLGIPQGETGATPNLTIGTVTTLEPDEDATATISGTAENPILSFGIPKGDTGEVSLSELEDATVVQTLSDNEPYNYRRTNGGNGAGHREYDEIVGASVGWNQLVKTSGTWGNSDNGTATLVDGKMKVVPVGTSKTYSLAEATPFGSIQNNHIYYVRYKLDEKSSNVVNAGLTPNGSGATWRLTDVGTKEYIFKNVSGYQLVQGGFSCSPNNVTTSDYASFSEYLVVDLTLFNSEIADYARSLEQSTAGSGVTWLKSHFPKLFDNGYQPFDSGSIKSVSGLTAHEMVGVNQWDEEWESGAFDSNGQKIANTNRLRSKNFIPIFPNTTYYFYGNANTYNTWVATYFYDGNGNFISSSSIGGINRTFVTPSDSNVRYMMFNTSDAWSGHTYDKTFSFYFSDTSINGQYFPYEKHTYPLDSSVTLRGQYKLDANNQLYADGDVYPSSGEIGRNWGEDLLNGDWSLGSVQISTNTVRVYFGAFINRIKPNNTNVCNIVANFPCYQPDYIYSNDVEGLSENKHATDGGIWLRVNKSRLSTEDAAGVKAWLIQNPITLVYPLKTPTTETATPYTSPQWCDSNGTEEYVGSELPVGHNTQYPMSLVDTMPKDDGSYTIQVDVANGKPSVSWVMPASASMIAPTEASYVATRNYTSGSLLIVNGTLYKVTANIANNGNIVPNTNCVATTLAEVISALA